jgi:pantoate--beta-alanine ligase
MVRDLDFRTEVVVMPTVREADGLAMSSRNARLEPADRERALALYRALCEIRDVATDGDLATGLAGGRNLLEGAGIEIEYLEARDFDSFETVEDLGERPVLVAVAAEIGGVRLIDNIVLEGDGEAIKDQTGGQVAAGEAR